MAEQSGLRIGTRQDKNDYKSTKSTNEYKKEMKFLSQRSLKRSVSFLADKTRTLIQSQNLGRFYRHEKQKPKESRARARESRHRIQQRSKDQRRPLQAVESKFVQVLTRTRVAPEFRVELSGRRRKQLEKQRWAEQTLFMDLLWAFLTSHYYAREGVRAKSVSVSRRTCTCFQGLIWRVCEQGLFN